MRKLNFENFKENQLTRIQIANVVGGQPTPPLPEIDENGNIIPPAGGSGNNGDSKP